MVRGLSAGYWGDEDEFMHLCLHTAKKSQSLSKLSAYIFSNIHTVKFTVRGLQTPSLDSIQPLQLKSFWRVALPKSSPVKGATATCMTPMSRTQYQTSLASLSFQVLALIRDHWPNFSYVHFNEDGLYPYIPGDVRRRLLYSKGFLQEMFLVNDAADYQQA
jgi:hypothetical protein